MKLKHILIVVLLGTLFCLLYVYQQADIYRLAYVLQKQQAVFQELLDKNTLLRYNIEKSASLIRIGDKISDTRNFQMPDTFRLVSIRTPRVMVPSRYVAQKESLVSRIFGIKRQAEASTINR
ncbi:MAG TPA: hypothetical protein VMD52_01540 [Patescibacteria group bacterium]|nr:hypothetical protein [Patescibacteria group bacterium]